MSELEQMEQLERRNLAPASDPEEMWECHNTSADFSERCRRREGEEFWALERHKQRDDGANASSSETHQVTVSSKSGSLFKLSKNKVKTASETIPVRKNASHLSSFL